MDRVYFLVEKDVNKVSASFRAEYENTLLHDSKKFETSTISLRFSAKLRHFLKHEKQNIKVDGIQGYCTIRDISEAESSM